MMARLAITLLGGFRLENGHRRAILLPRKAQALVARLALRPGARVAREAAAAWLWGEREDALARHSLRQTLYLVGRALGTRQVTIDRDTVALRAEAIDVDVAAFERRLATGTPAALAEAARLYQGELLDGFVLDEPAFDEWLMAERHRLRERAFDALSRLFAHQVKVKTPEAAIQTGVRLLELDPLHEAVHRALIRLYLEQGRRGAAREQYRRCAQLLQRELGLPPEPETLALGRSFGAEGNGAAADVAVPVLT